MELAPGTPDLPWRFPFQKDAPRSREVLRPLVSVRLVGREVSTGVLALVDSGCEHILAAPWLIADAKVDLEHPKYEIELGIGGGRPSFKFVEMRLRLQYPGGVDAHFAEWDAEVGFSNDWRAPWPLLLGQHGFFDQFTVSMHRSAALTVIEEWGAFDRRFGAQPCENDIHAPRLRP